MDKIREIIALINDRTVSRQDYIKAISIVSTTSMHNDDEALKKGVELAYVKNYRVEEVAKSLKRVSQGIRHCSAS